MSLTFSRLEDYPFKSVESVQRGELAIGLLEKQKNGRYKAFVGTGFSCRYLRLCDSKSAAVEAIERAAANL